MRESDLKKLIKLDRQAVRQRRNRNLQFAVLLAGLVLVAALGTANMFTSSHIFYGWGLIILAVFSGRESQQAQSREQQYRQMLAYVIDTDPMLIRRYNRFKAEQDLRVR